MVDTLRTEVELSAKQACQIVGISRSLYYAVKTRSKAALSPAQCSREAADEALLERIRALCGDHPFWGYRRVWAWLRFREHDQVNKKRVYRLMRKASLTIKRRPKPVTRTPRSKPKATRPKQYWGIDMTKFLVESVGWVYLVIVLDWYTKKIVGYDISLRCRRQEWEAALDRALQAEFPDGVRGQGLRLVSDNGSQVTATGFMKNMALLEIEQVFTSYNNPKGNAETERMIRTIKEEVLWLEEFTSFSEAKEKIGPWNEQDYNELYPHSALGYYSPVEFEALLPYQAKAA